MGEENKLNKATIIPILDKLRKPNGDRPKNGKVSPKRKLKTFDDIVSDEWDNLGLEGAPNLKLIELILINAIKELYGDWDQETDETERKKKARMRDANLLSFGLLGGYYHTEEGANTWLSDRYEEYLKKTDFVKIDYSGEGSYEEIARKDKIRKPGKQPRPLGSLTHFVSDGKEEIASKVFDVIHGRIYKDYLDEDGKVPTFKLPKPCYTSKSFPPPTEQDDNPKSASLLVENGVDNDGPMIDIGNTEDGQAQESEGGGEIESINPNPPEPSPPEAGWLNTIVDKLKTKLAIIKQSLPNAPLRLPKASSIALVISVSALAIMGIKLVSIIEDRNTTKEKEISQAKEEAEKIVPTKIEIMKKNIKLSLGEDDYLIVKTEPSELNPNDLLYTSSNRDAVHMEDIHSNHMIATDDLADNVKNYSEITVQDIDGIAQDTTTVIVRRSQKNDDAVDDKNDDEASSGNFEESVELE